MAVAHTHGRVSTISINAEDISADCDTIDLTQAIDVVEYGVMTQASKLALSGQEGDTLSLSGYFDSTVTTGAHTVLSSIVQNDSVACIYGPEGNASGKPKASFNAVMKSYKPGSKVGGLVTFSAEFVVTGGVTWATFP